MPRFRSCKNETGNSNPPGAHLRRNRWRIRQFSRPLRRSTARRAFSFSERRTTKEGLPGSYQLRVWHENLGEEAEDVVVNAGTETKVTSELTK